MRINRQAIALDPRRFGRRPVAAALNMPAEPGALSDDLRLFALTFAAGFTFVSVLIA